MAVTGHSFLDLQFMLGVALVNHSELADAVRLERQCKDGDARRLIDAELSELIKQACHEARIDFQSSRPEIPANTGTAVLRFDNTDAADELADAVLRLASAKALANDDQASKRILRVGIHGGGPGEEFNTFGGLMRLTAAAADQSTFISSAAYKSLSKARQQRYLAEELVDERYEDFTGHRRMTRPSRAEVGPQADPSGTLPRCFLIMPFNTRSDDVLRTYLSPACKLAGAVAFRSDWDDSPELMPQSLLSDLRDDPLAIAYLGQTPWNANVMLEIGFRMAVARPLIVVRDAPSGADAPLPFDLSHFRVVQLPLPEQESEKPEKVQEAVTELSRVLRDRIQSEKDEVWTHPHPTATAKFMIHSGESVYLESSEEADRLFGMQLKGRSVQDFIGRIGHLMDRGQHEEFVREQGYLFAQVTSPQFYIEGKVPAATIPIVLRNEAVPDGGSKAFLPIIVNYWKLGSEVVLRVLYLDVTAVVREERWMGRLIKFVRLASRDDQQ